MQTFTDKNGEEWIIELNLETAERIDSCDFTRITPDPICFISPDDTFFKHLVNPSIVWAMIWCCVVDQAKQRNISEDEFRNRIAGDVFSKGREAFWREIAVFFPQSRTILSPLIELNKKMETDLPKAMQNLQPEMEKILDEMMIQAEKLVSQSVESIGERSTSSPVS